MWAYLDESGDLGAKGSKHLVMAMLITEDIDLLDSLIKSIILKLSGSRKGKAYLKLTGGEIKFRNFPDKNLLMTSLSTISNSNSFIFSVFIDKSKINGVISQGKKELIFRSLVGFAVNKYIVKNIDSLFHSFEKKPANNDGLKSLFSSAKVQNKIIDGAIDYIKTKNITKITADLSYFKQFKESAYYCLEKIDEKEISKDGLRTTIDVNIKRIKNEEIKNFKDKKCLIIKVSQSNSRGNRKLQALDLICGALYSKVEHNERNYFNLIENKLKLLVDITKEVKK
ncbi:MAG: DUF3800 domain-containing protein [archaeon]